MKTKSLLTKMVLAGVVLSAVAMFDLPAQAAITSENLFDIGTVHSLYIIMDMSDSNAYEDMRFSAGDDPGEPEGSVYPTEIEPGVYEHTYWQAYIADDPGGDFINVAIRRKSDHALPDESDPDKFSLKIDINRQGFTPPNQRFGGKKKLSLECGSDNALIKEGLAWAAYRETGMVAGRANWMKVYISTDWGSSYEYKGLFVNVEQVDKEYLEDHMPDRHEYGFLYKLTEYNGDVQKTREAETNPFEFNWYPFDHPQYIAEDPTPADWLTQTPLRVDMDQMLKFAVVENFVANADGTINKGNNFYYYDWATHP
ncbi:MAG: hypothetical protein DRP66_02925, partial [Planctomycetota bacterium]